MNFEEIEVLEKAVKAEASLRTVPAGSDDLTKNIDPTIKPMVIEAPIEENIFQEAQPGAQNKSGDTYFPIVIGGNPTAPVAPGVTPLTEQQKRQRMLIGGGVILALLVLIVVVVSRKKAA